MKKLRKEVLGIINVFFLKRYFSVIGSNSFIFKCKEMDGIVESMKMAQELMICLKYKG
ncbi:MAG: hypothetical protein RSC93_12260 [Erysipelotrichaceae bacterium]